MRKANNTIVFGSQNTSAVEPMPASIPIPAPEPPLAVRMRPIADDLVDERRYMGRPERGLAFAAMSLALIGVAAAGTYFFFGSREPVLSTTTTTSAEMKPPPSTTAETPTPAPTPSDQPWNEPEVDAVRAPSLKAQTPTALPKEIPGAQVVPTERPQAANQAPAAANPYASQIKGAKFPGASTAKEVPSKPPPAGMSDEALERAGYYGNIPPLAPSSTVNAGEPKAPSAASTEEPKQFTPPPAEVMPDMKIKE